MTDLEKNRLIELLIKGYTNAQMAEGISYLDSASEDVEVDELIKKFESVFISLNPPLQIL